MYKLRFKNVSEIRMGSPYNCATIDLQGSYVPDLSTATFQDIGLLNLKKDIVYLVQWETTNNDPGFRIWKIEESKKSIQQSERISGFCKRIFLNSQGILSLVVHSIEGADKILNLEL